MRSIIIRNNSHGNSSRSSETHSAFLIKDRSDEETDEEKEAQRRLQKSRDTPFVRAAGLGDTSYLARYGSHEVPTGRTCDLFVPCVYIYMEYPARERQGYLCEQRTRMEKRLVVILPRCHANKPQRLFVPVRRPSHGTNWRGTLAFHALQRLAKAEIVSGEIALLGDADLNLIEDGRSLRDCTLPMLRQR